jgi:SAM-dependent methyltransferase
MNLSTSEQQRHYYDEECDPEFEIERPHGCGRIYDYLIEHKFQDGMRVLATPLRGRSVLEVCAGSGMMAEKFAHAGADVTATDFSPAAIARAHERARRHGFSMRLTVAAAERLPFRDRNFDVAAVHDGLHHLERPERAIAEMARVARYGVLIMDPAQAALTRVAVRAGIAEDVEEAGNPVRRLDPVRVAALLRRSGFGEIRWRRRVMYYPHRPWEWLRWFDHPVSFAAFRAAYAGGNLALGRWGNKLALAALRTR